MIGTDRLVLRSWREDDRPFFRALNADPDVMHDYPTLPDPAAVDTKFDRYRAHFNDHGFGRWVLELRQDGDILGYVGPMPFWPENPLGPGMEMGWRLKRSAWGHGYASEAARAALADGFARLGFKEVWAVTGEANLRSQAVMARTGMVRVAAKDYRSADPSQSWLVWVARP